MAAGQGKVTKDLDFGAPRRAHDEVIPVARGTRLLVPVRSGKELSDALIRNWEETCKQQSVTCSSLTPELEMLASDRKSERLVNLWVGEVLGEDDSEPVAPQLHAATPAPRSGQCAAKTQTPLSLPKIYRFSPGRRAAACLLGIAGILAIAFVAVPSPQGLRSAIFAKAGLLPAPIARYLPASMPVSVTIVAPSDQAPWLDTEITLFNRMNSDGIAVQRLSPPGDTVHAVLDGKAQPTIFAPERTGGVERLNHGWLDGKRGALVADIDDPQAFRRVSRLPLVVLNAPWVTARQRAGGIAFLEFLARERSGDQKRL